MVAEDRHRANLWSLIGNKDSARDPMVRSLSRFSGQIPLPFRVCFT